MTDRTIAERLAAHGFSLDETGGGCTAWARTDPDGFEELIVSEDNEMTAPEQLDERCAASLWEDGDCVDCSDVVTLADVLAALDNPSDEYALITLRLYNGFHRATR